MPDQNCKFCAKLTPAKVTGSHKTCLQCCKCYDQGLFHPSNCRVCKDLFNKAGSDKFPEDVKDEAKAEISEWIRIVLRARGKNRSRIPEGQTSDNLWFDARERELFNPWWDEALLQLQVGSKAIRARSSTPAGAQSESSEKNRAKPTGSGSSSDILKEAVASMQLPASQPEIPVLDLEARDVQLKEQILSALDAKIKNLSANIVEAVCSRMNSAISEGNVDRVSNLIFCSTKTFLFLGSFSIIRIDSFTLMI